MVKNKRKLFKAGIIGFIQKIIVMVFITVFITFLISHFKDIEFELLLGYIGMGITAIGGVGGMGGGRGNVETTGLQVLSTGKMDKNLISHLQESYKFSIFMISSGVIIMLISVIV